jgi:vitamin B12 transporter
VGVFYQQDKLTVSGFLRKVDGIIDGGTELPGYEVLDVSVRYQATDAIEVYARLENAFDEDYQDIATFNTAGASAYAGFRYQF